MIRAQHKRFYVKFFELFSKFTLKRHFKRVEIVGDIKKPHKSILLIGNHFSWWDGFIANYLNKELWRKNFHVMMLEKELEERMFLSKSGAFSINPQTRSVIESIKYSQKILENPNSLLVLYPQGQIESMHKQAFTFQRGIEHLIQTKAGTQLIMYVALVDYFSSAKPTLTVYLREYSSDKMDHKSLESSFNAFYQESIKRQKPEA